MLCLVLVAALVCSAAAQLPTNCGAPAIRPKLDGNKIVSNTEATPNSWPWQLQMRYFGGHRCGASVITPQWALTAAHCVEQTALSGFSFRAGRHTETGTNEPHEQISAASRIIIHEKYFSNRTMVINDVALVRLTTPYTFNNYVSPVCLAETQPAGGRDVWATGWGDVYGTCCDGKLKQLRYAIVSSTDCSRQWRGVQQDASNLCAGRPTGYPSICQGDSGGPLVQAIADNKFSQVGISSYVGSTCGSTLPNVYANVATLIDWIKSKISTVEEEEALVLSNFQPRMGAAFRTLAKSLEDN